MSMDSRGTIGREPQRTGPSVSGVHTVENKPGYFVPEMHPWDRMKKETKRLWGFLCGHNQQIIGLFLIFCMFSVMGHIAAESSSNALISSKDGNTMIKAGFGGSLLLNKTQTQKMMNGAERGICSIQMSIGYNDGGTDTFDVNADQLKVFLTHKGMVKAESLTPGITSHSCLSLIKGAYFNVTDWISYAGCKCVDFFGTAYNTITANPNG